MVVKQFQCDHCETEGKISIRGSDIQFEDIVYCPVCGSDIYEEEDFADEDDQ